MEEKVIDISNSMKNVDLNRKLVLSTGNINREYEIIGLVFGNSVAAKNIIKDMGANLKSIVGGRLGSYEKLLRESRDVALRQMVFEANTLQADAIIYIKQGTSSIMQQASEVSFIGTAVKFK